MAMPMDISAGAGAAVSTASAVAQGGMNPIADLAAITQVVGFGMSLFGGVSAAEDAKHAADIQSKIAGYEGDLEDQRHKAMELAASRQSMEIIRSNQRSRSLAVNNAVNQGANLGSGLQGGLAQVQDQSLFNLAGVNQNLEIGQAMFGINKQITEQKQQLAQVQGQSATDQGIASMGGTLVKAGPTFGNIVSSYTGGSSKSSGFGNYSGTPGASNTGGFY